MRILNAGKLEGKICVLRYWELQSKGVLQEKELCSSERLEREAENYWHDEINRLRVLLKLPV